MSTIQEVGPASVQGRTQAERVKLPSVETAKAQVTRYKVNPETAAKVGHYMMTGATFALIALGVAATTLAIVGLVSNPIGWGILAGLGVLALTAGIVGGILIAKYGTDRLFTMAHGIGKGLLAGSFLIPPLLVVWLTFGLAKLMEKYVRS